MAYIADGKYVEATEVIREEPFSRYLRQNLSSPSEGKCRRGELDDPVSIRFQWLMLPDGLITVTRIEAGTPASLANRVFSSRMTL